MARTTATLKEFAKLLIDMAQSDRDNIVAVAGFTGEGKSCFSSKLCMVYGDVSNMGWSFNNCTWNRKEFIKWVNGEQLKDGTLEGQKKEYSAILLDELFSMFYSRNWHKDSQKEAVALLNMCRDRHLLITGNVPNFWNLDRGFITRVRYYVYIPLRGVAWVFQQETNPFSNDPWNVNDNRKRFRLGKGRPYRLPNFLFEINYTDWKPEQKEEYYNIRNKKRIQAQEDVKSDTVEKYTKIKKDRDNLIKAMNLKYNITQKDITDLISLKKSQVNNICLGIT